MAAVLEKGWYKCTNKAKDEETGKLVCPNARTVFKVTTNDVGLLCGCEHRFVPTEKP